MSQQNQIQFLTNKGSIQDVNFFSSVLKTLPNLIGYIKVKWENYLRKLVSKTNF